MKRNTWVGVSAGVLSLALVGWVAATRRQPAPPPSAGRSSSDSGADSGWIAADGRVEPRSRDLQIGAELNGKIVRMLVKEGDRVQKGQVLAVLDNRDAEARVELAQAQLAEKRADLERVLNGSRPQERRQANDNVAETRAVLENSRADWERAQALNAAGVMSRQDYQASQRAYEVAQARYQAASAQMHLVVDRRRPEDRAEARAQVKEAEAQLALNQAMLEKTLIRSPIDGTVLVSQHRLGEEVSASGSDPVFTLGDISRRRVLAEVYETDIAGVHLGEPAYVTADAFGSRRFSGRVVEIRPEMGKINVYSDQPTQRLDSEIMDVWVELKNGEALPSGLRVTAFIRAGDGKESAMSALSGQDRGNLEMP